MKDKSGIGALACMVGAMVIGLLVTDIDSIETARADAPRVTRTVQSRPVFHVKQSRSHVTRHTGYPTYTDVADHR
jgi:hypothetical protein